MRRWHVFSLTLLALVGTTLPIATLLLLVFVLFYAGFRSLVALGAVVKFIWAMFIPVAIVVRSLFASGAVPEGDAADPALNPELFEFVRQVCKEANVAPFRNIVITDDFNCGIRQRPRYGILGFHDTYLEIGLPLMLALDLEEFRGILAHECGHLNRNHGRLVAWLLAQRDSWIVMLEQMQAINDLMIAMFRLFYNWYVPLFDRKTARARRLQEFDADRIAARLVGVSAYAAAYVSIQVRREYLDRAFWQVVSDRATFEPEPPTNVYFDLALAARERIEDPATLYAAALGKPVRDTDTHPPTSERLATLGIKPEHVFYRAARAVDDSAAQCLLTLRYDSILALFSKRWAGSQRQSWRARHAQRSSQTQLLHDLDELAEGGTVSASQLLTRALLAAELGRDDAIALLQTEHVKHPADTTIAFSLGVQLLPIDAPRAIAHLMSVAARDLRYTEDAPKLLAKYFETRGDRDQAENYAAIAQRNRERALSLLRERQACSPGEHFEPSELSEDARETLARALQSAGAGYIRAVYFARRCFDEFPDTPQYLCAVLRDRDRRSVGDAGFAAILRADGCLPLGTVVKILSPGEVSEYGQAFAQVRDALIYTRSTAELLGLMTKLYDELARWWPLLSPVEEYLEEAAFFREVLQKSPAQPKTVLELGSGGGNNAALLKPYFSMTLTDISEPMLAVSRVLNPECEHLRADMRTVRLGRLFDAVFVHDAIMYMTTRDDLARAIETAFVHCRPGGVALFVPDHTHESFVSSADHGGTDGPDGGVRYLSWSVDPDPSDDTCEEYFSFILREHDGTVTFEHERHLCGSFSRAHWNHALVAAGFLPPVMLRDAFDRDLFLAEKPLE